MIWFTLGNISVVGTYYTHGLNLTPRGLLAVTAAASLLSCAAAAAVPYCREWPRVGYRIGYPLSLIYSLHCYLISFTAESLTARGLSSRPARSFTARGQLSARSFQALQLAAVGQLSQLPASISKIHSANTQLIVTKLLP